ncbi:uncharacterized protein LOC144215626 [Stigmatopora nigra]
MDCKVTRMAKGKSMISYLIYRCTRAQPTRLVGQIELVANHVQFLGMWEETGVPRENPCRQGSALGEIVTCGTFSRTLRSSPGVQKQYRVGHSTLQEHAHFAPKCRDVRER